MKLVLRYGFRLLALGFILKVAWDLGSRWKGAELHWQPLWLLPSFAMAVLGVWLSGRAWLALLSAMSETPVARLPAMEIFVSSQLARYTPGKVGLPAVRFAGAEKLGVSPRLMGSTLLIEVGTWSALGLLVPGLLLATHWDELRPALGSLAPWLPLLALAMGLGLLALASLDRRVWPQQLLKLAQAEGPGPLLPFSVLGWFLLHWASWVLHGAFLAAALCAPPSSWLELGAILALGVVLGFLALFAPGGAGVREAVMSYGALPLMGPSAALAFGLACRGLSLASELGLWFYYRRRARSQLKA